MQRWCALVFLLGACGGEISSDGGDGGDGGDGPGTPDALPAADAPGGIGEPAELAGMTLFHNEVRARVQTSPPLPPLAWDPELAATAAAWVARCVDEAPPTGLIDHNPGASTGHPYRVGENVYGSTNTATAKDAVDTWAFEEMFYDYATNTCSGVCGHYTQIVWRSTEKVGCAVGVCPNLRYDNVIVCNYGPAGNLIGSRPY